LRNLKLSKRLISYLILIVITLILIYLDSTFIKVENPSSKDIMSEFLICIQAIIWIYFEKSGFKNSNHYRLMSYGITFLYVGLFQDLMDEFYEIEGILAELENIFIPIGLIIISVAIVLRFLEEEKNKLLLSQKTEDIYDKSIKDPLTGLYNRYHLEEHLETILDRLIDINSNISVAFIDIDDFKAVNDVHGHLKGDELLTMLGTEIRNCIRESDYAFRYGGDEFLIIYPNTKVKAALTITERVKKNISSSLKIKGIKSSLSIGVTSHKRSENYKALINRVDKGMYESKKNGKNQITVVMP